MEEKRIKQKIEKKIELDLMDWKSAEANAEKMIREEMMILALHELARKEAKWQIRKLGGKTSEEEKEEAKIKIEQTA